MRGQATPISHEHQMGIPKDTQTTSMPSTTSFPPTSNPSAISGRLDHPWFLRGWARTSPATFRSPSTPGSFQTYLLFTIFAEQASVS